MKIDINFEIGECIWYIDPKTMKAEKGNIKSVKILVTSEGELIKYNLAIDSPNNEYYVRNVFKTKNDLLKSL